MGGIRIEKMRRGIRKELRGIRPDTADYLQG